MKKKTYFPLLMTLLLGRTVIAIGPGDMLSFELIGYQYIITDEETTPSSVSHFFIPPNFPSLEKLFMVPINPSQPPSRWEFEENDFLIKSISFTDERFIEIHYQQGKILEGVYWHNQLLSTDGVIHGESMGFPLYKLSFIDEHHNSKSIHILPDLDGGGYAQVEVPVNGNKQTVFALYKVDFNDTELPEITDEDKQYKNLRSLL